MEVEQMSDYGIVCTLDLDTEGHLMRSGAQAANRQRKGRRGDWPVTHHADLYKGTRPI
ncbi:hypothetical protein AB0P17_07565 [Streptomyces sp. NPDC088124]|uniref:hypothetical protein n=1 Tax=Streptomyces sp. NPDC088124 TaxID=3154654 RepID=UPI003412AE2D